MNRTTRHIYNAFRTVIVVALLAAVLLFTGAYVALSIPAVQDKIRQQGQQALSDYLGVSVTIGRVGIQPFDRLTLNDVLVPDLKGDTLLTVDCLGTGFSWYDLLADGKLVFSYAELIGMDARITRPDKQSDTNLQFIIDRFKPNDEKPPRPFDVRINNVVIRRCQLSYDVLNERQLDRRFDPNHICVSNLRADVSLPKLKNDDYDIDIKRLSLDEKSGFTLKNLVSHVTVTQQQLDIKGTRIELPQSAINLADISLRYSALNRLGQELPNMEHQVGINASTITPSDLKAFVPLLAQFNDPLQLTASISGNARYLSVPLFKLNDANRRLDVDLSGMVSGLDDVRLLSFNLPHCHIAIRHGKMDQLLALAPSMSPQAKAMIRRCETIEVSSSLSGTPSHIQLDGTFNSSLGKMALQGVFEDRSPSEKRFKGHVASPQFSLGRLLAKEGTLGQVAVNAEIDATLTGKDLHGSLDGAIPIIDLNGRRFHNITANVTAQGGDYDGHLLINDANGKVELDGTAHLSGAQPQFDFVADVAQLKLDGLVRNAPVDQVSFNVIGTFQGSRIDRATGSLEMSDIELVKGIKTLDIDHFSVQADNVSSPQSIHVESPIVVGDVQGSYDFATLVPSVKAMLSETFPQLFGAYNRPTGRGVANDLDFRFDINPSQELQDFVNLPVQVLYKTTLEGSLNESTHSFDVKLNAPYMLQGSKNIIEQTTVTAQLDSVTHKMLLAARTTLPSKKGKIYIDVDVGGRSDSLSTFLAWRVDRERDFSGQISLSGLLARNLDRTIRADVDVHPTQLVFNDTVWQVQPGKVSFNNGVVSIYNLVGQNDKQYVRINGQVSKNPEDVLSLQLGDISLDYVFETLNIDNVDFGGRATGDFFASDLLSKTPRLLTPRLHVDDLSYNDAVMGDADIESQWLNQEKGVSLKARLDQKNGHQSIIDGVIFVADDSLYLDFDAHHANVAFMKPFMKAFTSDVQGEVSGHAVLLGKFSTINLYGDIVADSLKFKIDYTNVYYTCSGDSVHIVPDLITFSDIRIHDREGHEARLDGWLRHNSFHDPVFNFGITNARDFLCYDTDARINPVWYGTVYGDGSAFVSGEPGQVDIKVSMQSAAYSRFTFVLTDAEEAAQYNFITFHDRTPRDMAAADTVPADTVPDIVRQLTAQAMKKQDDQPTHYSIDLQGEIDPDAQLILVMDPVGGDQIKATGHGNMRLTYNDANEMTIFGKYVLEKGDYNFTLQDIIIKDFTIKDGSSISFQGDPYAALLDIEAVYALNANLRDLDETFASDKEITRTNVPVHALLRAKGGMSEPEISFDLEFPTLTSDAYRKVKSVISTDEMMNQQIIYLLALNRFYTPDYMNTAASRSGELTSVASSTISSQLTNILGKMSDNWTIAPNFRSDKGDFSDVEVDLALSSQLLNNRLLFNGNFGYRDNTYNTQGSNFIGDFDIQYLLNTKGTLRLKAYNHFNDQNYYVRNALTTQGVGIVWKHDFNNPFRLNTLTQSRAATDTIPTDTLRLTPK